MQDVTGGTTNQTGSTAATYLATYQALGIDGRIKAAALSVNDLESMRDEEDLEAGAVDMLVQAAAQLLQRRTDADVRVFPTAYFKFVLDWASLKPGQRTDKRSDSTDRAVDTTPPEGLSSCRLGDADFVLMPWAQGRHFSLLVLCNPGKHQMGATNAEALHAQFDLFDMISVMQAVW